MIVSLPATDRSGGQGFGDGDEERRLKLATRKWHAEAGTRPQRVRVVKPQPREPRDWTPKPAVLAFHPVHPNSGAKWVPISPRRPIACRPLRLWAPFAITDYHEEVDC